jgi:Beta propeller domain
VSDAAVSAIVDPFEKEFLLTRTLSYLLSHDFHSQRFTAVRFFDNIAYAVTFEQTDPFYVLDFTNPETPVVLGELEILGFSSYLHSINSDNTKILGVGRQATADGTVQGLKISLYDATVPTAPKVIDEYIEEQPENTSTGSSVEWDPESFRYLNLVDTGRLIIPMSIYTWSEWDPTTNNTKAPTTTSDLPVNAAGSFEGFAVFAVENDKITRQFYITHTEESVSFTSGCWSCGYMEARSFVFNGDVVTMKLHSFLRTDLDTGVEVWNTYVDTDGGTLECCSF